MTWTPNDLKPAVLHGVTSGHLIRELWTRLRTTIGDRLALSSSNIQHLKGSLACAIPGAMSCTVVGTLWISILSCSQISRAYFLRRRTFGFVGLVYVDQLLLLSW